MEERAESRWLARMATVLTLVAVFIAIRTYFGTTRRLRRILSAVAGDNLVNFRTTGDARVRVSTIEELNNEQVSTIRRSIRCADLPVKTVEFCTIGADTLYRIVDVEEPPALAEPNIRIT